MAGSFPPQNTTDFWDQYQQAPPTGQPVTDPTFVQASGAPWGNQPGSQNTGINGGNMGGQVQPVQNAPSGGGMQPQVIVNGPNGWYKPNPGADWIGPNGERLPPGQNPPGYIPSAAESMLKSGQQAAGGGGGVTMDDFNRAWMASPYPGTVDGLKQFYASDPKWAAAGVTLGGSKGDKVYGPGGSYWGDYVISAGTGGAGKSTGSGPTAGGGGAAGGGSNPYGFGGFGSLVTPMSEFTPPTEQDALNSPGLQFALSEANRMGQNSAAARGTLLNGRFQQALAGSNIQNALQGYQGVYDRAANAFGINYGVKTGNQDRPFSKFFNLAQLGQQATSQS